MQMLATEAAGGSEASAFVTDPLGYFDRQLQTAADAFPLPDGTLCVAEPEAAKAVLANRDGLFEEHSDFFHTRRGPFGPRSLQVTIGRGARRLLSEHVAARAPALPETVARELEPTSMWPDAGNRLIYRHLAAALVAPERAGAIGGTVERVLERGVFAGARERRSFLARALFRRRVFRALTREVERRIAATGRRKTGREARASRDLFDVLALAAGPGVRTEDLGELYLPLFFAVVSSVGFSLGWAIYLLGTEPRTEAEPPWVAREALRLWPVAWQLARRPAKDHRIAGVEVGPETVIVISPYVTQRHPAYWREPNRFRPSRWADGSTHKAYFPFGWGPHTCVAAALTLELVEAVLSVLLRSYRSKVSPMSDRPFLGPSLAPPRFRLDLERRSGQTP